jgi:hypothetical protein
VIALGQIAVMTTAWRRPYYFERVLESWAAADGIGEIRRFVIALGPTDRYDAQVELIEKMWPRFGCPVDVVDQSPRALKVSGPHTAIAEAITGCFADPAVEFVVAGEEDVQVSSDILTYMQWAATALKGDRSVLIACAHSRNGQGWDLPLLARDAGADQEAVRLRRYFNPWGWGTWRDRWETVLEPEWDYECNSGGAMTSGYDWNVQQRILPRHKMRCAVPDASRSQNIGKEEGWASRPETFALAEAFSFRERRDSPAYRLEK